MKKWACRWLVSVDDSMTEDVPEIPLTGILYLFWDDLECLNGFLISNEYLNNELPYHNLYHMTKK